MSSRSCPKACDPAQLAKEAHHGDLEDRSARHRFSWPVTSAAAVRGNTTGQANCRSTRSTPLKGFVWEPKQPESRRAMMRVLPVSCRRPPMAIRIVLPNAETLITFAAAEEHWLSYFTRPLARMGLPAPPFSAEPARPFPVCAHPHSRQPERPMLTGGGMCRPGRKRDEGGCPTQ